MTGIPHPLAVPINDASRVGEARRAAAHLAEAARFDDVTAGRLAVVVAELATNLLRHAVAGQLLLSLRNEGERSTIDMLAMDGGPGIHNISQSLQDGYSTAGSPGTGLGAVRRMSEEFDIYSTAPGGTLVMARVWPRDHRPPPGEQPFTVGAAVVPAPGETVCGDAWAYATDGQRLAMMVADGLGHGPDAARAAEAALAVFKARPFTGPGALLEHAHAAMRDTRGAAITVVEADASQRSMRFAGAGNVVGRLISGVSDRSLIPQNGTVGLQLRRIQEQQVEWPEHALLVLHSDGISTRWDLKQHGAVLQRHPAIVAGLLLRNHCRGRDDATVVVLREGQ